MYDLFLSLSAITIFVMMPVLIVMLIVRLIKKKPKKKLAYSLSVSFVCSIVFVFGAMFTAPDDIQTEVPSTTEQQVVETTEPKTESPITTEPVTEKVDTMVQQFIQLGFTQAEAEKMKDIFSTVGITEISNIKAVGDNGIDNLQAFKCDIYDYRADKGGISLHFTIDKRQLCFISLNGIPTTKTNYYYINIFGNVKAKTSNSTKSVTLYDTWDENGEIDNSAIGYQAVFDYENSKITKYEP